MSLPRELLDELLSRYMDGELSVDERQRVEKMLADDAAMRESLRSLREQSALVRKTINTPQQSDGETGLGASFADRVFAAAVAEAERTGTAANHPVRLAAAGRPNAPAHRTRRRATWGGILTLAASVALATLFFSGERGGEGPIVLEEAGGATGDLGEPADSNANLANAEAAAPEPAATEVAAATDGSPATSSAADPSLLAEVAQPAEPDVAVERVIESSVTPESAEIASAANDAGIPGESPEGMSSLRAMFVYEIHVTAQGRENGVVNRAFKSAQIRTANRREIDEAMVSHLTNGGIIGGTVDAATGAENGVELIFLEGSARRLEQLMMNLLEAREEVSRVGFSMVMEPPVFMALDRLQAVNATEIQSVPEETVALALAPAGMVDSTSQPHLHPFLAGEGQFQPLDSDSLTMMSEMESMSATQQPDFTSQVLLIIRND